MKPRLVRSEEERMIAGVCGGLAQYLGVDPVLVRLAFLLLIPAGGVGLPLYFILMIIMPNEEDVDMTQSEIVEKNLEGLGDTISSSVERSRQHPNGPVIAAALLILMGFYFLFENFGWVNGSVFWPLALILLGIFLLVRRGQ
ncbi:MAG TPA: PspC domain-containing protein [Candidatus Binatia bacterium]|nr:PspC domain-containing protein [Candidatus Binatia bacterium]